MIYHITTNKHWKAAQAAGTYEADSLQEEGFIHTSKNEQVKDVLHRYYHKATDLVLLHIDESKLTSPLVYELAPTVNEIYPHIYGPLNLDAVVKTEAL